MSKFLPDSQKDIWEYLNRPENRGLKMKYQRRFKKMFPLGHEQSIRPLAKSGSFPTAQKLFEGDSYLKNLGQLHPRAFDLLAEYGTDYKPRVWKRPPRLSIEPRRNQCFGNAWMMMYMYNDMIAEDQVKGESLDKAPMVYVEGLVFGAFILPMLHAWNSGLQSKEAVDWSLYACCKWNRYLGIPLTAEEYRTASNLVFPGKKQIFLLLDQRYFPESENYLVGLLEERRNKNKETKAA